MKKIFFICLLLANISVYGRSPKYIFYFIGDGMGMSHVALTQAALSARADSIGFAELSFTAFPVQGKATTYAATRLTTDSAAAGTALATGHKTSVGTIGMNADHTLPLQSVAEQAQNMGRTVGVITSVSIDHATPAAFYAHQPERGMYHQIAAQAPCSGFSLLVGGGFIKPDTRLMDVFADSSYTVVMGRQAELKGDKVLWVEKPDKESFEYAIDRKQGDMALDEVVEKSIRFLCSKDNKKGVFAMVEGGKIDWAAHSNDAATVVREVVDFSQAIAHAVAFYKAHPKQTLIVVTADHETGGISLGRGDRNYDTNLKLLFDQPASDSLKNEYNKKAGVGFTSGAHTAAHVPVYALGVGAELFGGTIDNTDIPKKLLELMK